MRGETRLSFRMSAAAFHRAAGQGSSTLPVDPTPLGDEPPEAETDGMIPSSPSSCPALPASGHGSEKRARTIHLGVRLTPEERAQIERAAESSGLSTGSYARLVLLGTPGPRQVRRPQVDRAELGRLLGEIGRVGNNLNQIAHRMNTGVPTDRPALLVILASLVDVRNAILQALGRLS